MTGAADTNEQIGTPGSGAALYTLLSVMFINLVGFGIVVPLLPFYAKSFDAAPWQIALVFSAYAIGSFFGEPFWGRLSDRIGRKPILISTVSGNCLCYMALAFAPNVYAAFGVRLLGGMASGNNAVIQGYIADVSAPDDRAGRMSLLGAAYNIGFIVGPALGGLLANPSAGHSGFGLPLFICSGLSALCAAAIIVFVPESRTGREHFGQAPSRWAVMGSLFRHPVIARLMLVTFLAGCAFNGVEYVFGLWTQARFAWGPRQVGGAFAVTGVVAAINQIALTGRLSRKFGEAQMLAAGIALTSLFILLQPFSTNAVFVVVFLAISAFGQSAAWPNVGALISRNVDWNHQGQYQGLNNAVGALARLIGPFIAALAFSGIGVDAPFFVASTLLLPAIFLSWSARRSP
jgi:MFS family permease